MIHPAKHLLLARLAILHLPANLLAELGGRALVLVLDGEFDVPAVQRELVAPVLLCERLAPFGVVVAEHPVGHALIPQGEVTGRALGDERHARVRRHEHGTVGTVRALRGEEMAKSRAQALDLELVDAVLLGDAVARDGVRGEVIRGRGAPVVEGEVSLISERRAVGGIVGNEPMVVVVRIRDAVGGFAEARGCLCVATADAQLRVGDEVVRGDREGRLARLVARLALAYASKAHVRLGGEAGDAREQAVVRGALHRAHHVLVWLDLARVFAARHADLHVVTKVREARVLGRAERRGVRCERAGRAERDRRERDGGVRETHPSILHRGRADGVVAWRAGTSARVLIPPKHIGAGASGVTNTCRTGNTAVD